MLRSMLVKVVGTKNERELKKLWPIVERVGEIEPSLSSLSDDRLRAKTGEFKGRLERGESLDQLLPEAFAIVREASNSVLGMRHYDS